MYLIDGNNVIGQRGKGYETWFSDKPAARRRLLDDLAQLARVRKLKLAVVFDGAPEDAIPDGSSFRSIKVFYARQNSDADSRIIEMVEAERNKKNLIVVTSDNRLAQRVKVCGVRVVRSGDFRQMMEESSQTEGLPDQSQAEVTNVEAWLRYFGADDKDDE